MKIYLNAQYKCVKVEDNTFVANSTSNFIRYYFVQNADGTLTDEITESTEVYLNQEPSYVTLGFRRADGNTIQHLMATPKVENDEPFWEYIITDADGVLYKKGALEVSAQFINATLNSENKIISQKVMAVAVNTAHVLDNIGEEAEEYYSQYEQANNEAHAALQAQFTTNFNNIGILQELTTDAKDNLVKAINEVDAHADANKSEIGDLSTLTTDEKTTIVGAINEVDNHADTAQQTAETAQTTADNATTLANNAVATANGAVATANGAKTIAEQAKTIATNSVYSVSFEDIQSAVTALNGYDNAYFKVGNSIFLKQKDVPDMWVYAVASEYVEYTYTTDDDFVNALLLGTVQVGYYVLANLESTGDYDVLKNKPIINQDLSADGFAPVENTYYRHTGTTSETYTAGVVYFYNGTAYKAIDGAGGEVPTSLPATGAKITGNLPTSGWTAIVSPLWEGNFEKRKHSGESIILPPNSLDFNKLKQYTNKTEWQICIVYSSTGNTYETPLHVSAGSSEISIGSDYLSFKIKPDGSLYAYNNDSSTAYFKGLKCLANSQYIYTLSDTAIKANSTVTMYLNSADEVRAYSKTDGSVVVEMDAVPTTAIPYTLQVVETSAEGAFEIINSYVPTIPETPTALPQTAGALKSGNLPTSGWTQGDIKWYWEQDSDVVCPVGRYTFITNNTAIANKCWNEKAPELLYSWAGATGQNKLSYNSSNSTEDYRLYGSTRDYSLRVYKNGNIEGEGRPGLVDYALHINAIGFPDVFEYLYTISDTDITENSDVLMELTDEGGVKSYSMEAGKMTVIRDTVPTQPIPYTYKVKQTNASGQFTVINHYTPNVPNTIVESVNGQTGAVTIAVPTKTSELTNDSGYVSNLPTVQNVVCNDVDSATTLDTTIPCEIGDLILAQIIVRSALTLPTGWSLLRTIPAVETSANQTLSFAYKRATSTSETLTVTQANAERIYTNLVRLSNATSISYIQSCEKTGTDIKSISSTKPVTSNMVIWGASSVTWKLSSPYGNWSSSPSTLDYYSLPQASRQPRLGTFVDSSGAGERTFSIASFDGSSTALMCGAVEIVGDEVARKGDIPTKTSELTNDSGFITAADIGNALYPVGSIYMSVNNTNPSTFFGGTWVSWGAGRVPVGIDTNDTDFATVEKTGGEKTHTLTVSEMPSHKHTVEAIGSGTTQQELTAFNVGTTSGIDGYAGTDFTGGGQAHNNLQPYITCYMWKRTE